MRDALACPKCKEELVHPITLRCNPAGELAAEVVIDASGLHISTGVKPEGRGVKINLGFVCEFGHLFDVEYRFHKGATFVKAAYLGEYDLEGQWPSTIWRD